MCFIKSSTKPVVIQQEPVERKQANAQTTKSTQDERFRGYEQNVKTSSIGLTDDANVEKKTLLGE